MRIAKAAPAMPSGTNGIPKERFRCAMLFSRPLALHKEQAGAHFAQRPPDTAGAFR